MDKPYRGRVAFYTLGCKTNQYDTQSMVEQFISRGYSIVDFDNVADVYVINTCTVTSIADKKSRQAVKKALSKNDSAVIAMVGCYPQRNAEETLNLTGVSLIAGTGDRQKIVDLVENSVNVSKINAVTEIGNSLEFEDTSVRGNFERTRAVLKIQDGCDQFCSYCIIPFVRGPVRSRNPDLVLKEAKNLVDAGYKEIVLTGIHIASYGDDESFDLIGLLKEVNNLPDIERIRLGSLDPKILTGKFIGQIQSIEKLCHHFHISLQSGSDNILKSMNRNYTSAEYVERISALRAIFPDVAVTTDIMVGFPGESETDFLQTCQLVENVKFSRIHVFKYSARENTMAASFEGKIPQKIKDERSAKLIRLGNELACSFVADFVNTRQVVIVEDKIVYREGWYEGYTGNYIKVLMKGEESLIGKSVIVNIVGSEDTNLVGELEL